MFKEGSAVGVKIKIGSLPERRSERIEIRITPTYRATLERVARVTRRTVTSLLEEWIEDLIKRHPPL